ncbi:MAG: response regulator [Ruminiclostridium sp.]|nr:response regulator [Ruminiclostridium sp.]
MNEFVLEIAAFVIALFCLTDCIKRGAIQSLYLPKGLIGKLKERRVVYLALLCFLMITSLADVGDIFIENYLPERSALAVDIINELYFIFQTCLPLLFSLYIVDMTGLAESKGMSFFGWFMAPFVVAEGLVLSNPFTRLIFHVDENACYIRGPYMVALYVSAGFYVLVSVVFFFASHNRIAGTDKHAMLIILTIATAGIVIQGLFMVKVELFFESIGLLCFLLLMEERGANGRVSKRSRISKSFIVVIALIFSTVILMNITIIYSAGTDQTDKIGEVQLNNLKGEMQENLSASENYLLRYSMGLEQLISDEVGLDEIEKYIREQLGYYEELTGERCFNVYAASADWTIIPDFDMPAEYHAVERMWYIGAKRTEGQVYITEPYIDADTQNLCYTFSYLLSDGSTVAAMDYTLSGVQDIIGRMGGSNDQFAMIVTDDGIVVGCSDEQYQGERLTEVLHQYTEVFDRVKASNEHRSFRTMIDGGEKIVFDSETGNGWKLILVVDFSTFYADIINQMIMLGTIDFMMIAVIVAFYLVSVNNQEKAERTLASTENFIAGLSGDIKIPLQEIIGISENCVENGKSDTRTAVTEILDAGRLLQQRLDNLFSYSNILKENIHDPSKEERSKRKRSSVSSRYIRNGITGILIVATLIGLTLCLVMTSNWGSERISKEAEKYDSEVTLWMQQKKSILFMFADVVAADPTVLSDYDSAVQWLDDIAKNYNELTFAYMANPYNKEHAIIMNNGWVPDPDYKVEEREWYIDTERSGDGFSISAPYFDAQTGLYCITFSRTVYSKDGEFLGIFAIDCLLDKLIDVLDKSYTADSYAFMVDMNGTIINHPSNDYEITTERSVNIEDTEYADAYHKGNTFLMRDYDGRFAACYTEKSELSGFNVVVVQSWWSIYGNVLLVSLIFMFMLVASIIGVVTMINRFIHWQEDANQRLAETASKAVAAEKAKSRFLAQMSHEIRTPINAVLGMNEMILRESNDASVREYAGNIHSAGKNLLGLINTILDFSKIEEGKMEILPVKYDTASMIENIINSISKRAADKGLVFEPHIDSSIPSSLMGDDMRVSQVAVNLLTNAVKYTREGRVDLYIDGEPLGDDALMLRVRVKDTGIGIREEDMGKLFESFTRLEESRNRNIEGTGLGMAIVNKLLDMMGSKLEVHSVYGEGSEFSFEVRQEIVDSRPIGDYEQRAREALEHEENGTYLYAPEAKLLIVDDNDMNLKVAENLLKLNGIRPDHVLSGADALEKLRANTYDVVMLDHMMPEMDGIETLQKAKEESLIPEGCAVIVLTANAVVGARETYINAGFDDYLSKPIEVKALETILGTYLPAGKVEYRNRDDSAVKPAPTETMSPETPAYAEKPAQEPEKTVPEKASSAPAAETVPEDPTAAMYRLLEENGIDTKTALSFCGGNDDFYRELLNEYAVSSEAKIKELDDAEAADDIKMYGIKVHSLKGISRTIGANALSDAAAQLQKAADEGDGEAIHRGHEALMEQYRRIVAVIKASDISGRADIPDNDDEIMEFMPK